MCQVPFVTSQMTYYQNSALLHTHRIVEQGKEVRHRLFFHLKLFKTERDQKFDLRDFSSYTTELKNKMQMNNPGLLISFILLLIM